ncbi:acetaldehyde dehydrogenase/alcohol dehydrogenase [Sporohalobacter salinus]|nr:acetaldehyde dehydrogenase/alcohol dehydrogenase [Sporohalobacter salinus]
MVGKAVEAAGQLDELSQQELDQIVKEMALAGVDNHIQLAELAVEETEMGVYEDKITKNLFATENVYHDIKDKKAKGIINKDSTTGIIEVAEPVGVIAALIPATNPTSTTLFKALIALKAGNPIIFSFHPQAFESSKETARIMRNAAIEAGAPEACIQWIEPCSEERTEKLMKHSDVSLILATGGGSMVKAAYSSGTPAIGVGPGNVPAYIEKSANLKQAVHDIITSKTFDNGTVCASEQTLLIDKEVSANVKELFANYHTYILDETETEKLEKVAIDPETKAMNPEVVGQSATKIAEMAGIEVPTDTVLLLVPLQGIGAGYPLSREKLSPILGMQEVSDYKEGIEKIIEVVNFDGLGHTAVLHSSQQQVIDEFRDKVKTGRLLVNNPSTFGAVGDIYNHLSPSMTLGCGTFGGNSTTANVTVDQLYNVKRLTDRKVEREWIKLPQEIYFNSGSLSQLSNLEGEKAVIITDEVMEELGYVEQVAKYLEQAQIDYKVFSEVEPDPSVKTVMEGKEVLEDYEADIIIALGGGSPIDAAKGMRLFYEHPEIDFRDLKLRFMDIKKRAYKFPRLGDKAKFVAIPTTSGSGSEITSFTVITDKENHVKYPLVSYELTPDLAIVDSKLAMSLPPEMTAYTGLDVLTHGIEAYVSVMASDYTDPLALQAIKLVFDYLPRAYKNGTEDKTARAKMHNAACIAGMSFTNAFLGINHSLAHILGSKFEISHGLANALLLPHVIKYNAQAPTKFAHYPNYSYHQAGERYNQLAKELGLKADNLEEGINNLTQEIKNLMVTLNLPLSIADLGIDKQEFESKIEEMARIAYSDQATIANPRKPLVSELEDIYSKAYYGLEI